MSAIPAPPPVQLAHGLHQALLPVVLEVDKSIQGVGISQQVLINQIDKLSAGALAVVPPVCRWRVLTEFFLFGLSQN